MKISVVGIGRVGLPLAAVLSRFSQTVGIDIDSRAVDRVNSRIGISEPYVADYLGKYGLRASTEFSETRDSDIVFICVGSQAPGKGYSADRFVSSLEATAPYLISRNQLLVITTTLPPQEMKEVVMPYIAKEGIAQRIQGYCYNPAMIALGKVVRDFEDPKYMMIGESNPEAGSRLEAFWKRIVGNNLQVFRGSILDVAVAKYALNTALVAKISLLSFLTEFCEKEGSDVDLVTNVLMAEPRVAGQKMFKGGLGYGGTCFPVDIEAVRHECEELGIPTAFPDTLASLNDWQVERSVRLLKSFGKKKMAVLGLSFKQDTEVVASSQSLEIADKLAKEGLQVIVYDPKAMPQARGILGGRVTYANSLKDAIRFGEVVFIGVEWQEFVALRGEEFSPDQVVVDPWRLLRQDPPPGLYVPYGVAKVS